MAKYTDDIKSNRERAAANLLSAKDALQNRQYDAAVASAAQSALCSATALLLDEEIEPDQHGDVITLIHQIFVNGRRLTQEQGEKLSWLFQLGKPEDTRVPRIAGEAQKAVEFAQSFFEATKVILES